ncbi:MAG: hypothetical protein U0Y96_09930 [Candidatus Kapaibacterium sp.]|nr:hypothetical protein [Bacteroidota bacterium]
MYIEVNNLIEEFNLRLPTSEQIFLAGGGSIPTSENKLRSGLTIIQHRILTYEIQSFIELKEFFDLSNFSPPGFSYDNKIFINEYDEIYFGLFCDFGVFQKINDPKVYIQSDIEDTVLAPDILSYFSVSLIHSFQYIDTLLKKFSNELNLEYEKRIDEILQNSANYYMLTHLIKFSTPNL